MLNQKHSAKHVCRTETSASSTARAGTSCETEWRRNKKFVKYTLGFPTITSGKGGPHGYRYGKKKGITSTSSRINSKRSVGNDDTQTFTIDLFVDTWFRKTMIELGRTEEVCREMDKLANEDHTHIATEEELNVYRSNWWIRSNFGWFCTRCP